MKQAPGHHQFVMTGSLFFVPVFSRLQFQFLFIGILIHITDIVPRPIKGFFITILFRFRLAEAMQYTLPSFLER